MMSTTAAHFFGMLSMLFRKLLASTTTAGLFSRHILWPAGLLLLAIGPASATTFSALVVFGDSTVDSGWWPGAFNGQCGVVVAPCTTGTPAFDTKIQAAIAGGGTGAPVGVGLMNTQYLARMLGVTAIPANQTGGTNYAISGSKNAVSGTPALGT